MAVAGISIVLMRIITSRIKVHDVNEGMIYALDAAMLIDSASRPPGCHQIVVHRICKIWESAGKLIYGIPDPLQ